MKLKILKYDKVKARWLLALLKFSELFALFLFFFGFYGLGSLVYNNWIGLFHFFELEVANYFSLWLCGFLTILLGICVLLCGYLVVFGIYEMLKAWLKANWRWAQTLSEDEGTKKERLREQKKLKEIRKIEKLEKQREKYGFCLGDIAVREISGTFGKVGGRYKVTYVNSDGSFDCKFNGENQTSIPVKKFKFIKTPLPKKPKLNPTRQKEVNERNK